MTNFNHNHFSAQGSQCVKKVLQENRIYLFTGPAIALHSLSREDTVLK